MAFLYRLETRDGTPADPATFATAVPNWRPGDAIALGRPSLRVIEIRDVEADKPPVMVVDKASS
jgi:hypothetical protein